jgi:hypothetical protein
VFEGPLSNFIHSEEKIEDVIDFYVSQAIQSSTGDRNFNILCTRLGLVDGEPKTLRETGEEFSLSHERIRQIEGKFYRKLGSYINKSHDDSALKILHSLLSIWIAPDEEAVPFYIASLLHRLNKIQYLKLIISLFYPYNESEQREKETRYILKNMFFEQKYIKSYTQGQQKKFNKLFKDVAWPENTKKMDINQLKLINPKRSVNRDNGLICGEFFSKKNNRKIEYESNIEYKFCMYLESLDEVIGYVQQPVTIHYKINEVHKCYYPDFLVAFEDGRGVLVEIKPRSSMVLYQNILKYIALQKYCISNGFGYLIAENYNSINNLVYSEIDNNKLIDLINRVKKHPIRWSHYKIIRNQLSLSLVETNTLILHGNLKFTTMPYKISLSNVSFQSFIKLHKSMTISPIKRKDKEEKSNSSVVKVNKEKIAEINQARGRPLNDYSRWSKDEEDILIQRYKDGMTIEELSSIHGRGKKGIKRRLIKLSILKSYEKEGSNISNESYDYKNDFIVNTLKPNDTKVANRNKELGLPINSHAKWTPYEEELLIKRYKDGLSIEQISELHERKLGGIRARLKKLGLIEED